MSYKPTVVKSLRTSFKYQASPATPRRIPGKLERVTCPLCKKVLLIQDINTMNCMKCNNNECNQLYHANCLTKLPRQTCSKCQGNGFVPWDYPMPLPDPADTLTDNVGKLNIGGKRKNDKKSKKSIKSRRSRKTRKTRK